MRALIYTRISRDHSGDAASNKRQEEACRLLCQMRGWDVVGVHEDVSISAYADKQRPGWERVKKMMKARDCDVVVAWKLDRVTRTVPGLVELVKVAEDSGCLFATTDGQLDLTSPTGKAVATILAAVAQMEVELKAERQALANKERRDSGKAWNAGWRAFGYSYDGEVVEAEAELIRKAYADVLEGKSLRGIAREWTATGLLSDYAQKGRDGKAAEAWSGHGVGTVLKNPRYAGWLTYDKEVIGDGDWEAIVTPEEWSAVQAHFGTKVKRGVQPRTLLAGAMICDVCEAPFRAGQRATQRFVRTEPGGKRKHVTDGYTDCYRCPTGHGYIDREPADNFVTNAFAMCATVMRPGLLLRDPAKSLMRSEAV